MFQSLIGILWSRSLHTTLGMPTLVSIPYRYSMKSPPVAMNDMSASKFQSLIGILWRTINLNLASLVRAFQSLIGILWRRFTTARFHELPGFQSLIGILWSPSDLLYLNNATMFQSLIGILWSKRMAAANGIGKKVSIPYRYSMKK